MLEFVDPYEDAASGEMRASISSSRGPAATIALAFSGSTACATAARRKATKSRGLRYRVAPYYQGGEDARGPWRHQDNAVEPARVQQEKTLSGSLVAGTAR